MAEHTTDPPQTAPAPPQRPPPLLNDDEDRFLEALDRVTWRVGRALMVGLPTLVALLILVPLAIPGIGPMPALTIAVLATGVVCVLLERRRSRRHPEEAGGSWLRRPSGPHLAVVGVSAAIILGYVLLISSLGSN